MRIDQSSSEPVSLPERSSGPARGEGPDFSELLQSFTREQAAPAPAARSLNPWAELSPPQLEAHADARAELKAQRAELRDTQKDLEETRRDAYLDGLEANQDQMEGLVERWKDRNPQDALNDRLLEAEAQEESAAEAALGEVEAGDDSGEIISDFEEIPIEHEESQGGEGGGGGGGASGTGAGGSDGSAGKGSSECDLSYQEIQDLVETALNSGKHLPPRVRQVLQELLGALLDGQRWLLDQHRLIGLEREEWRLLQELFPAHFYAGLLRQHRHSELPLYDLLQALYEQAPPDQARREQCLALWQPALGDSLLLRNWVLAQPLPAQPRELANLLELWQQHQALPPGAIGRCLQLALAYRHHPERMQALFLLAGDLFHGKALMPDQIDLLAACVSERCYPRALSDTAQIQALLAGVLAGAEPDEAQLHQLLLGCSQGVLSYLPYSSLCQSLQDLQDYVRRDLLGREEAVPGLLKE